MKLAMVSPRCPPYMGGIETHIQEVAPRLAAFGIDLTVLTTDTSGKLEPSERVDGVLYRRFPAWPRSSDLYVSPPLIQALGRGRFDLVHVQGVHTLLAPLALAAARRAEIPAVLTFHTGGNSSTLRSHLRTVQWRSFAPILRSAQRLIAVCEFEQELFQRTLRIDRGSIALIRNGSEPLPLGASVPEIRGRPLVLSIGRLERYKGHHRAIDAMKELRHLAPEAHLAIVGSGPYERALRARVSRLSLEEAVSFVSFLPSERAGLGGLVASADVVTLLSDYEAHPVTVMEALALGRDVVCADTSGLSELGRDGLVRTVDVHETPKMTAVALLDAAMAHRWRTLPPSLPSWDECARSIRTIYMAAIG